MFFTSARIYFEIFLEWYWWKWLSVFKSGCLLCLFSLMMLKGRSGKSFRLDSPPTLMTLSRCWRRRQISSPLAPCFTCTQSTMKRQESSHTRSTRYHLGLFHGLPLLTCAGLHDLLCKDYQSFIFRKACINMLEQSSWWRSPCLVGLSCGWDSGGSHFQAKKGRSEMIWHCSLEP